MFFCQQVGHQFNCCTFVDDKLRQLLREEVMNVHQPVIPTLIVVLPNVYVLGIQCRNPTLAKCGGEAQHLEKVRIWSPLGLPNVQSSTARPKTPRIGVFLVSLERS